MIGNPIQYTSRTFNTILNDINSDSNLKDTPDWYKRIWAGIGDMLSMIENVSANQSFLRTAFTRQAVSDLLQLIDYTLASHSTSSGSILFYLIPSVSFPVTFSADELKSQSQGTISIPSKKFESRNPVTVNSSVTVFTYAGTGDTFGTSYDFGVTGHKVRLTTTGSLPAGLTINTDYYIVRVSPTSFKLATSLLNAYSGIVITPTTAGSGTHSTNLLSFSATVYQQETKDELVVGTSDGSTEWQEFAIPDSFLLDDTLIVTDSGLNTWTQVTTFVNSISTDKHYKVIPLIDNMFNIQFGNGDYGAIPPSGNISVTYAVGGGSNSNVSVIGNISLYSGGNSDIVTVSNPSVVTGGGDAQGIENAKILAPILLKARDTFVTKEDGESLVLAYGGVSQVKIDSNYYGVNSCRVIGVATGGGNPSGALESEIQTYLIERSVLSSVDVRFVNAIFSTVTAEIDVNLKSGFLWVNVLPYLDIALKLFYADTGKEIQDAYINFDLSTAITLLNNYFTTTFSEDDQQIENLISNLEPIIFADTRQESDLLTYIQANVRGVNYIVNVTPSFPLVLASNEITTTTGSSFTINEV